VTLFKSELGNLLLATDFHNARVDVFDENFDRLDVDDWFFEDRKIPAGLAPVNVLAVDEQVYVTYAKQDADAKDDLAGAGFGFGFVDLFTNLGVDVRRIASRGSLNAPWGLAIGRRALASSPAICWSATSATVESAPSTETTSRASCGTRKATRSQSMACGPCCRAPKPREVRAPSGSAPARTTSSTGWWAS
jgi:hypothetical protein